MDQSLKHTEWEKSYTGVHTVWFHFYEGLEQGILIYGEKKNQQSSTGGRCVVGHWLGRGMKEISAVIAILFIMWASYSLQAKPGTPIIFVNKVVLEHGHAKYFIYCLWLLSHMQ